MPESTFSISPPAWIPITDPSRVAIKKLEQAFISFFNIFGYSPDTPPNLQSIVNEARWLVFRDASTSITTRQHAAALGGLKDSFRAINLTGMHVSNAIINFDALLEDTKSDVIELGSQAKRFIEEYPSPDASNLSATRLLDSAKAFNEDLIQKEDQVAYLYSQYAAKITEFFYEVERLGEPIDITKQLAEREESKHRLLARLPGLADGSATVDEAVMAALDSGKGIIFGEDHENPGIRNLMIRNMKAFKTRGVGILFLEGKTEDQDLIDRFDLSQGNLNDRIELATQLGQKDYHGPYSLANLVASAKGQGIPVYFMDSTFGMENDRIPGNREAISNPAMAGFIKRTLDARPSEKIVGLVGAVHTDRVSGVETFLGSRYYSIDNLHKEQEDSPRPSPGHAIIDTRRPRDPQVPVTRYNDDSTIVANPQIVIP